jgi:hypothetical protein
MRHFLSVLLLTCCSWAQADCGSRAVMSTTRDDGTKIGVVISDAQFMKAPAWSPDEGDPPISIAQVVKISSAWAKENFKRFDSVQIRSISLSEVGCASSKRSWYYLVHFTPILDGSRVYTGGHFAGVLMDGTVIGPTKLKSDF